MNIIIKPRNAGKTTEIIKRAARDPDGILVEPTESMVDAARDTIALMRHRLEIDRVPVVVNIDRLRERLQGMHPRPVIYIDNADYILQQMVGECRIKALTMSEE